MRVRRDLCRELLGILVHAAGAEAAGRITAAPTQQVGPSTP